MPINICRYVPLQRFCEMVFFSELCLLSPEKWNDKYENYILQLIKSNRVDQLKDALIKNSIGKKDEVDDWIDLVTILCTKARCLCFSKSIDEEVIWNAYKYNNETIMWITTDHDLENLNPLFDLRFVNYDLESIGFLGLLKRCYYHDEKRAGVNNDYHLFTHKRKMFSYENELRLINGIEPTENTEIYRCPIPSIKDFIKGVMVHPLANSSYISLIELLCSHFDIPFIGRSSIYNIDTIL